MGFWHGANWTFVIWGLYHAALVMAHRITSKFTGTFNKTFLNISGWFVSLPFLMLGWIPFRVTSLQMLKDYSLKLIQPSQYSWLGMKENTYLITFILLIFVVLAYLWNRYAAPLLQNTWSGQLVKTFSLSVVVALVIVFLRPISQFIYFQF